MLFYRFCDIYMSNVDILVDICSMRISVDSCVVQPCVMFKLELSEHTQCHGIAQIKRDRQSLDSGVCEQVRRIWRAFIVHSMVPTCRLPEHPNSEWGLDQDTPEFEIWFRNTHRAGMIRHLTHHGLEAFKDRLADAMEGDSDDEQDEMLQVVEMLRPLGSDLIAEMHHQLYNNRFGLDVAGTTDLCPELQNAFACVVEQVMIGSPKKMRELANAALAKRHVPSHKHKEEYALPKNYVQLTFERDLRLVTYNWYDGRAKSSGAIVCTYRGARRPASVCQVRSRDLYPLYTSIDNIYIHA